MTAKWRAAGFARRQNIDTPGAQITREHTQLGRFAAAVNALKRDKFPFQAVECSATAGRRSCETEEIACLKIKTSGPPTSSSTENLSKLLIRPETVAPCNKCTTTAILSRRAEFKKASCIFWAACFSITIPQINDVQKQWDRKSRTTCNG